MRSVLLLILITIGISGCAESSFELHSSSRLPKWVKLPDGVSRDEVKVVMSYYINSNQRYAVFKVVETNCYFSCKKSIRGKVEDLNPTKLGAENYPMYEVVDVDGTKEVIEHRTMEPVYYIVDDPIVLKEFKLN